MPTFIYAPGVKVYIQTAKHGLVDVSNDLSEGTMVRRSDGVSTFNWTMNNPRRKYDSVFAPNDRIVCVMKRLAWVRTFTGLLNSVPLITVWPRDVPLAASCSLKRLQYWYWDPHAAATQEMIRQALAAPNNAGKSSDGGITNVVVTILDKVVGWPASKVHISRIPDNWFDIARKIAQQVDAAAESADAMAAQFYSTLGGAGSVGGGTSGVLVGGKLSEGQYGGKSLAGEQLRNSETIFTVGKGLGMSTRDIVCGLACAMQESQLKNLTSGDRDSQGLFQQRPSQGWGSVAQITTPTYAATKFFVALKGVTNRDSMRETQAIQAVQRSGFPDAYQKWVPMAEAVVRVLTGIVGSTNPLGADPVFQGQAKNLTTGGAGGKSTGQGLAQVGVDFVNRYPRVMYQYGSRRDPTWLAMEPPGNLDCSAFVASMYFRLTGNNLLPAQTDSMISYLRSNGGKQISPEAAMKVAGALLFIGSYPGTTHMEISLGDGTHTVGTRKTGTPASVVSATASRYTQAYLVPSLTYDGNVAIDVSGVGSDPGAALAAPTTRVSDLPGFNPNDPFDKLFGNNSWAPNSSANDPAVLRSGALTGIRALLNDEPLLPYIKNLFNSTMRSFCSAPNGDLIAWFPDYYGLWGTAAKMVLEPIEIQDFTVEWADDFFVTHQFTMAPVEGGVYLDIGSGNATESEASSAQARESQTLGIASIDIPAMMYALFGIDATAQEAENFAGYIYKRFGARPSYQPMPGLQGPKAEFFSAMFMFMRQWAYQYNADLPLTFMPELYPGMLIQVPAFDFQCYVTTVTHTFRLGKGGGFSTSVNIAAPARMPKKKGDRDNVLIGLPLAGDYKPGRGVGNVNPAGDYTELPNGKPILR